MTIQEKQDKNAAIIAKIVGNIQDVLERSIPGSGKAGLQINTLLELAKELDMMVGVRGRGGGFVPTDAGLQFAGVNVAEYRNEERIEREREATEALARKTARQNTFAEAIEKARSGRGMHS